MFNKRRQSRDKNVIADIVRTAENKNIYVSKYSKALFKDIQTITFDCTTIFDKSIRDCIFIENITPDNIFDFVDTLIIYRWNTNYPYDVQFDFDLSNFKLTSTIDFIGHSHKQITKEIYKNEEV